MTKEDGVHVLILQHVPSEGPGLLGSLFAEHGLRCQVVRTDLLEELPNPREHRALVVLGGPMNVYEEHKYPFLSREDRVIKEALALGIPCLGICLGAQLMAKALGAPVFPNPIKEIGIHSVALTPAGRRDPMFRGFPPRFSVFQWHGDTFRLPEGATLLATAPKCLHQAFRYGPNAYALQFHLEVTPAMVETWTTEYGAELNHLPQPTDQATLVAQMSKEATSLAHWAKMLVTNLIGLLYNVSP